MKTSKLFFVVLMSLLLVACKGEIWKKKLSSSVSVHIFENDKCRVYNDILEEYTTPLLDGVDYFNVTDSTVVYCVNGLNGMIDVNSGKIFIEEQYNGIWVLSEGLIAVRNDKNMIGFINTQNEVIIPFKFEANENIPRIGTSFFQFKNGYCLMSDGTEKYGFINKKGEWVVEPQYDMVYRNEFGYYIVEKNDMEGVLSPNLKTTIPIEYNNVRVSRNDTTFLITKDGIMNKADKLGVISDEFIADRVERLIYIDEIGYKGQEWVLSWKYAKYEVGGYWGVYNIYDNFIVLPAKFDSLRLITSDLLEIYDKDTETVSIVSLVDVEKN